jgi:polysaccharide export outer membrane protein
VNRIGTKHTAVESFFATVLSAFKFHKIGRGGLSPIPTLHIGLVILLNAYSPFTLHLLSQDRSQAESTIRNMSPDEMDRRLKELGMSKDEAIQRAKENGINVEDYLRRFQAFEPSSSDTTFRTLGVFDTSRFRAARYDSLRRRIIVPVRGFSNRLGADSLLQPFGYDVFQYPASTFEPVLNIATPQSYVLGPGDEVVISVWGDTKLFYQLVVNREGNLVVPEIGPIGANGLTVQQFREKILKRMTQAYSGLKSGAAGANTFLDLSLGRLRTIQVFVLGEVVKPGGFTISSMSTAFHAVFLAGGPTINGTLRNIQVIRPGEKTPDIDLYDYLIRGDRTKDVRLQDGDVVLVKPAGKRVAVVGRVSRPAIYEIREKETLGDVVSLAGGLLFDSYFDRVHIERIIPFDQRTQHAKNILDLDVEFKSVEDLRKSNYLLSDGDIVTVRKISDLPENKVTILGNVQKPGTFELKKEMRVSDLILLADSLKRNTFSERGTLFRLLPNLKREVYSFNPRLAISNDALNNLVLQNEDSLVVYEESQFFPQQFVTISGAVRHPGIFPRYEKLTVGDLAVLAGGITEAASLQGWEVARIETTQVGIFSKIFKFNAGEDYWNNGGTANFELRDFDQLNIPFNPKFTPQKSVTVAGYVMYPGTYTIKNEQEKVDDLITRAGGLKPGYYLEASRLTRKRNGAGLVPIDFIAIQANPKSPENISVVDGDSVYVANRDNVVYVRGEVFVPSAVVYKQGASLAYYINQAGGYREEADAGRTVVSLPDGRKWEKGWFIFPDPDILGGSMILVPRKIEKPDNTLQVISSLATILASLAAITVALVQVTK